MNKINQMNQTNQKDLPESHGELLIVFILFHNLR